LQNWIWGLLEFLFQLGILLYCLGSKNFWIDAYACLSAGAKGELSQTSSISQSTFNGESSQSANPLKLIWVAGNERVFAPIFWFVVLGPVGVVLYRTISLAALPTTAVPALPVSARFVQTLADWLPIRLLVCLFALVGNFMNVFNCLRKQSISILKLANTTILMECGAAAINATKIDDVIHEEKIIQQIVALFDRTFIITVVLIAILAWLA
jgi:AmpE protein